MLPLFLRGIVVPNRRWTGFCARWLGDPVSVRFIHRLRHKYASDRFFVRLLEFGSNRLPRFQPVLLITGADDIAAVMSDPDSYGSDALSKVERMALFQPGAVIISGGEKAWRRRAFNESVLDTGCPVHRAAPQILEIAAREAGDVARLDRIHRSDFERLALRITQQTVLGAGRVEEELSRALSVMIREASRLWWFRKAKAFDRYYDQLNAHLRDPAPGSLLDFCRRAHDGDVPVASQVTHWLFAMQDSLETHVPRTLALITSHPDVEARVRGELADADLADPQAVDALRLLEACVNESIRLWTPVSLLLRRTTKPLTLNGAEVAAGTTVLIHAACDHRDPVKRGDAAGQFNPDQWLSAPPSPPMNHFSNGPRVCAGKPLGLLLIKAIVAGLLQHHRFIPESGPLETYGRLPYLLDPFTLTLVRTPLPAAPEADAEYDFIVVGSGAGGGPLAANLARGGRRVLLLEAGGDASRDFSTQVPVFHPETTEDPEWTWRFFVQHYSEAERRSARYDPKYFTGTPSVPGPQPGGGIFYPRASTLGGCTVHNAMLTTCPHNSDWNYLAKLTGDPSWNAANMRPYFQHLERCRYGWGSLLGRALHWLSGGWLGRSARHGYDGWLTVDRANRWLVFRDSKLFILVLVTMIRSYQDCAGTRLGRLWFTARGIMWAFDPNHWRRLQRRPEGIALMPAATRNGRRDGPREYLNRTRVEYPDRLVVLTDALVTRVVFDENDPQRAVGVTYLHRARAYRAAAGSPEQEPPHRRAKVNRSGEVVLCAGTFNTPQLLMLSGIGPRNELDRHGIEPHPAINLPGVGSNLQDRYEMAVVVEMRDQFGILEGVDYQRTADDRYYFNWQTARRRRDLYATNGILIGITRRSAADRPDPDLFIFGGPGYFGGYEPGYSGKLARSLASEKNVFTWAILKGHGNNMAGNVSLSSADPRAVPYVNFRYFDDPGATPAPAWQDDLRSVLEGIQFVRRINNHLFLKGRVKHEHIPGMEAPLPPLSSGPAGDSAALADTVKRLSWGHHAAGTCRMGRSGDGSVVDHELRVHGARNLRVVDASVFPRIPGLFIAAAVYMIAEKASDLLLTGSAQSRDA